MGTCIVPYVFARIENALSSSPENESILLPGFFFQTVNEADRDPSLATRVINMESVEDMWHIKYTFVIFLSISLFSGQITSASSIRGVALTSKFLSV